MQIMGNDATDLLHICGQYTTLIRTRDKGLWGRGRVARMCWSQRGGARSVETQKCVVLRPDILATLRLAPTTPVSVGNDAYPKSHECHILCVASINIAPIYGVRRRSDQFVSIWKFLWLHRVEEWHVPLVFTKDTTDAYRTLFVPITSSYTTQWANCRTFVMIYDIYSGQWVTGKCGRDLITNARHVTHVCGCLCLRPFGV